MPALNLIPLPRLIADIGGTNARFAWQAGPGAPLMDTQVLQVSDFFRLQDAIRSYLEGIGQGGPGAVAIAIANPITGDQVNMTNADWSFSQAAVKAEFGLHTFRLLNDFTALALALPDLPASELRQVGGTAPVPRSPIALLGAGTGLGVSGLIPVGETAWVPLAGEGGHVTLPAITARERLVMDGLARRYGHASAERLVCGQGLLDTFGLLCQADGIATGSIQNAAAVTEAALKSRHPQAVEALTMFCAVLGTVAGNLALSLGAHGGVYVGGGIVPRLGAWFDSSPFRQRFEDKGRFRPYLAGIPVWVITSEQSPALLGAARSLDAPT
ncbi:MAG: glucokinase [Hydrogenophaga sp.]|uniref:glucokinase n=1 Tax=Hydrogenophaga sp. TaxID=1904254 RepID=UPI00263656A0|nr:glucokinase [Hydrogenophaga sp.]MDM7941460.1 glucokinase [Hydrogenophaga sp.]